MPDDASADTPRDTPAASPGNGHQPADGAYAPNALPSVAARALAFVAILVAGACGGIIGFAFVDLQCSGDCGVQSGLGALLGAVLGAGGVAVVVTLALRAMGEWRSGQPPGGGPSSN